jgi:hypothetical protein
VVKNPDNESMTNPTAHARPTRGFQILKRSLAI